MVAYGTKTSTTDWVAFLLEQEDVVFFNPYYSYYIPNMSKKYYKKNFKSFPPGTVISFVQD